jgi:hypothetical protein
MGLPPGKLKLVSDAIGDAFSGESRSIDDFARVVKAATGNGLFEEYATKNDPARKAVYRTLEALMQEGTERWLLVHVLMCAVADEKLRRLIVGASPDTLGVLPNVDELVGRALQRLEVVKAAALQPEFLLDLKPRGAEISVISEQIRRLSGFKDLHECLHGLHLKLAFRTEAAAAEDLLRVQDIDVACGAARTSAALLGEDVGTELTWVAELERIAAELRAAIAAADAPATATGFGQAQRMIRLQLSRLNAQIFEMADTLTLAGLIEVMPRDIGADAAFKELSFAIRELKAAVMARALVHKIWQDAENDLSLIEDVLLTPAGGAPKFVSHWLALRTRVILLASLDPDAEWAKLAKTYTDQIEAQLTQEKIDDRLKPSFGAFARILKFRFLAVDATLKADCGALGKFHVPLKTMVEDIANA